MSDGQLDLITSTSSTTLPQYDIIEKPSRLKANKRNDIQYLRALAIVGVLGFHLKPSWLPQGYLGVDIFFVISGYLMTAILNYNSSRPLTITSLNNFYLRRIKRIFPVYYLIILSTLILCSPFLIDIDYTILKSDTLWSMSFTSNIQSMFNKENYFQRLDESKFLLHTWSLSVEIQYYLIAPFLLYIISCLSLPITATVILALTSWCFQVFYPDPTWSFGFVFSRLWQFLLGTMVFYFEKSYIPMLKNQKTTNALYALSMVALMGLIFIPISMSFSIYLTVAFRSLATMITAMVMFLGTQHSLQAVIIMSESLCLIGDISYSIYLVHWPIIVLLKYLLIFDHLYLIGIIAFIILVAILQYQVFETKLQAQSTQFIMSVITLLVALILAVLFLPQGLGFISAGMNEKAVKQNEQLLRNCNRQLEELRSCKMEPHFDVPSDGKPLDTYLCSYEGTGNATIMLAGNSFVMRQYESIIKASSHKYKKLYLATQSMCTVFTRHNDASWHCGYVSNRLKEFMTVLKPDMMIVTQRLSVGDLFNTPLASYEAARNDSMTQEFKQYWREYSELTRKIVIVEPHPTFYGSPKENLAKLLSLNASLDDYYISQEDYNSEVNPGWWRTLASVEDCPICSTIPIRQYFCHPSKKCDMYDARSFLTLFCDPGHLTTVGVERFVKDIAREIESFL